MGMHSGSAHDVDHPQRNVFVAQKSTKALLTKVYLFFDKFEPVFSFNWSSFLSYTRKKHPMRSVSGVSYCAVITQP